MAWLRYFTLPVVVGAILFGFSHVGGPEEGLFSKLERANAQAIEQLQQLTPTVTATVFPSAPTPAQTEIADTPVVMGSPTAIADVPTATTTDALTTPTAAAASPTLTNTPVPSATAVVKETSTATGSETPTPSPITISGTPTATPTLDASLPTLAAVPDDVGAIKESTIDSAGGRMSSNDGRVTIDFPAGATGEALNIKITKRSRAELPSPSPDRPFVGLWNFDASSVATGKSVHLFAKGLTITLRFSADEMYGLDARNLVFWTFDDPTGKWLPHASQVYADSASMVVASDHFSVSGATASNIVDMAPLLDGRNTDLHSGASTVNIPIELPAGRGGLTPQLNLSYNSGRMDEMRTWSSLSSWVGQGWDLDVPNIQFSQDPGYTPGTAQKHRAFLSLGALGGELLQDPGSAQDADGYIWRLRDEQYVKVRSSCSYIGCENGWTVWDQKGTKYFFGGGTTGTTNTRRYYFQNDFPNFDQYTTRDYRADISYMQDVLGNRVDYSYARTMYAGSPAGDRVLSSYPSQISYNGGLVVVNFTTGCDETPAHPAVCMRRDVPRNVNDDSCPLGLTRYSAPLVMEIKRLNQIEVKVSGSTLRRYDFSYQTDQFITWPGTCPPQPFTGNNKLLNVKMLDRNLVSYPYTTTSFTYGGAHHAYLYDNDTDAYGYDWPYLTQVDNAFGGHVYFTYQELGRVDTGYHWSRSVVTQERHATSGQPDMTTNYSYNTDGPDEQDYPNPLPLQWTVSDTFNSEYRGFKTVTETDAAGNQTTHSYYTTGAWADEVRTGHEYDTVTKDAGSVQWQRLQHTWSIRTVSNDRSGSDKFVNFVYPSAAISTLRDGTVLTVNNTFDAYGLPTQVDDQGESGTGDRVLTNTGYYENLTSWIFLPRYVEKIDADNGNALLGCARSYYDGATTVGTTPTRGLLTAVSNAIVATTAQCEGTAAFTQSTNSYSIFETYNAGTQTYGNVAQVSVPTTISPEGGGSGAFGWIPGGVANSSAVYDSTYHVFPTSQTNALAQQTLVSYDYVLGKPTSVTEPTGHVTTTVYDALGRPIRSYDNLDSDAYPTVRYTYVWDPFYYPLMTRKEVLTVQGTGTTSMSLTCMDGFGREVESRQTYNGGSLMSVRTEYDNRGLKSTQTNPVDNGADTNCIGSSSPSTQRDRTLYSYDPLGNVISTMAVAANQYSGPSTQAIYNGKTTTTFDEKFNRTQQTRSFVGRTLTVTQPSANPTVTTLRPSGQGFYSQWAFAVPSQSHYLNVREVTADDDTTQYNDGGWNRKDTQAYPSAGLATGSTINTVRFKFRWKHLDNITPDPGNEIWAIFRQGGVDTRGPAYHRTNSDGWGTDSWEMSVNPRTGQPWTVTELNAGLEFGFEIYPTGGSHPYITQAYIEIVTASTSSDTTVSHFDGAGRLIDVTDPLSNKTSITYDLAGRKLSMNDRDMGAWSYSYDAAGSLATQTDAKSIVTTIGHDAAERVTSKTYSNGDPTVSFLYDSYPDTVLCPQGATAIGAMTRMTDGAGAQYACYDVRRRAVKTRRTVDGVNYDMASTYDPLNQVNQLTYPDNDVVTYNKSAQGNVTGLSSTPSGLPLQTLMSSAVPKPWGAVSSIALGNGSTTSYTYDFRTRVTAIQTGSAQNLTLTYDAASNVATTTDNTGTPETVTYGYDQLNRLTSATGFAGGQTAAYTYNAIGNLLTKQEGSSSNLTLTYPASGLTSVRPHAVSSTAGTQALTLGYDADGNLATQGSSSYGFNADNHLTSRSVTGGTTQYTYDGNGTLLKRATVGSPQVATLRPTGQGTSISWIATPNVTPHYLNIKEVTPDDDTTKINQGQWGAKDTHTYGGAGLPAGAVIDNVSLKFRWKHYDNITPDAGNDMWAIFRQSAVDTRSGTYHKTNADGYGNSSWDMTLNPRTGQPWTLAEINGSLEFGFEPYPVGGASPHVTQAWLEITYRAPTASTVYIGGVYEKNSDGSVVKYYGVGGSKAMRVVPSSGGAGTIYYVLSDHLGSASTITTALGAVYGTQKYWPYGGTRSATGTMPTDKQYTAQQIEPGDSGLGLYNYKARFYSTAVGRFISADPLAVDGLNRYSYVGNSPVVRNDPTGLFFLMVSGFGATCQIKLCDTTYEAHVKAYWALEYGKTEAEQDWLWGLLRWTWNSTDELSRLNGFDIAFDDPSEYIHNNNETQAVWGLHDHVNLLQSLTGKPLTYAFGHSYGGLVLHDFVAGSLAGAFGDNILYDFRGFITNASPSHDSASLSIPWAHEGVDLFKWNGHTMAGYDFRGSGIAIITRGGASGASGWGHIADWLGLSVDLRIVGAHNWPGGSGQHADAGARTIYNDLERVMDDWTLQ